MSLSLSVLDETFECLDCRETLPLSRFRVTSSTGYRSKKCKACEHRYQMAWRKANPDKVRAYNLRHNPITGMTLEEYDGRLAAQDHVCAICSRPETRMGSGGKPKRLSIDHDHETHEKRGLLCDDCNNMLGRAHDDPARLRAAADYLERWGK